ncbi:MAG: N-formylglutamate amidohydrolase [Planctomycetaceae bacterium]
MRRADCPAVVITCEHGGNRVPAQWQHLFKHGGDVLETHRAWDPGALVLAKQFAAALQCPLHVAVVTRLLVELNRSLHHPALFSEFSRNLSAEERQQILNQHWYPYRSRVEAEIAEAIEKQGCVIHLSVHSFTPVWQGIPRRTDIGLLYDPSRSGEKAFCHRWQSLLVEAQPGLTIHRNAPYRGIADGFVTHLRKRFTASRYIGIELEVSQKFPNQPRPAWSQLQQQLITTFSRAVDHSGQGRRQEN